MKIGLLLYHSGPTGLWTPGCEGSAITAVEEINGAGGALGDEVSLVSVDAGSTPQEAFAASRKLTFEHNVDTIIGLQGSHMRPAVRDGISPKRMAPFSRSARRLDAKSRRNR